MRLSADDVLVITVPPHLRGPDVSFVSAERLRMAGGEPETGWFRLAPDLVVEVDIHVEPQSARLYRADGTARLVRADEALDGDAVLPGLRVPIADLFAGD